jgi:hypothetical protein
MLLTSAFVIGIGVLMVPILRAHSKAIAAGYLGSPTHPEVRANHW